MFNIRKKLAVILVAAIVVGQCGVSVFADEQLAKAVSKSAKLITVTTESDAEYDAASDSATDANAVTDANNATDEDYTTSSNAKYSKATSSNAKYVNASSSDADYEDDIDFVPEQLLVSVRGGLDGLYFTVDENQDTTFLDDFTFESLAVIDDKYDRGNDIVEVVGEPEEDAPDEIDFSDDSDEEKSASITEYQVFKVTTPGYKTEEQLNALASKIEKLPAVQYAELNKVIRLASINSDDGTLKGVNRQWAYKYQQGKYSMGVTDPDYSGTDKIINWDEYKDPTVASPSAAPKIKTTTNNPVVAVMDTGIDYTHEDLINVMWKDTIGLGGGTYGYDATVADPSNAEPMDINSHGTHCAGIIAAEWNGIGVSGITSGVELMAIKISGDTTGMQNSYIIKGYEYLNKAQDAGVNVVAINCSWAGPFAGDMLNQFVTRAGEKGAVSCFGSGNDSLNMDRKMKICSSLINNPYTVIVNACNDDGDLASFSNYGLKSTDVAAPGLAIYSTVNAGNKAPDCCSPDTKPVVDNGTLYAMDDYDEYDQQGKYNDYFDYTCRDVSGTYIDEGGLNDSGCLKLVPQNSDNSMCIKVKFPKKATALGETPTSFGFAIRCPKTYNCDTIFIYAYLNDPATSGVKSDYANAFYVSNSWQSCTFKIDDKLKNADEIYLKIYCKNSLGDIINRGYDVFIDRMMFTNEDIGYVNKDGTSMATPAVTGEAAILSEYFYQNGLNDRSSSDKSERAKNIVARIKGSVQIKADLKDKMQSGGMVRADYAVHGKTNPVINDLTINKINGKYIAELKGYFFDGNAGKDENDESFVSMNIDGKNLRESNIISRSAETIKFYIPSDLLTGEHFFEVISTKGTGIAYIESHVTDITAKDRFIQIPISDKNADMMEGVPLCMKAVNGNMYLLVGNVSTNVTTLWYQNIEETLFGSNQAGEWTQVKNFDGSGQPEYYYRGDSLGMTVIGNKLIGIGIKNYTAGVDAGTMLYSLWEFDTEKNEITKVSRFDLFNTHNYDYNVDIPKSIVSNQLFYIGKRLFLTYSEYDDKQENYKTYYCELNTVDYSVKSKQAVRSNDKQLAEIVYDGSNYYVVCGQALGDKGFYTIDRLEVDTVGNTGITGITQVNSDVLDGIENLYNDDPAAVGSAAYVNGKTIFTGPSIAYDEYIEADTYMMTDMIKSAVPVNKFVSTSPLINTCCTVDNYGNYYVIANTWNTSHNWIYAYTDMNELGKYVHKDRVIWSYDIEGSSGGNGSNTATPYYPSYVEKGGKWVKVTVADGKITWRFTDSKGQLCINKWVAIPDEDGLTGGPFGWYRFDADGNMITGWYTDDKGRRFYLDPTEGNLKGKMKTGWILIDGKWYYFKETGKDDFGVLVPDKVKS